MKEETYDFPHVAPNASIDQLGLSVRSYNALKQNGINSLPQLMELTEEDLYKIRNLGAKSVKELLAAKAFYAELHGPGDVSAFIPKPEPAPEKVCFLHSDGTWREDISIDDIGFSNRASNCLHRGGYSHVSQLIGVSREELLKNKNMGKLTADEILQKVDLLVSQFAEASLPEETDDETGRLSDFCKEVYDGIGVLPKTLYAALQELKTESGASLTGESLCYRAYDLPFMKAALQEKICALLYEAVFDPLSRESLDAKLPIHLFNTTITDEALIDLENEGRILETDDGYVCRYPRIAQFVASIEKENERLCLTERLKGRSLEEIGQENSWTRERVRQLVEKALKRERPRLYEDCYSYLFDTYYLNKADFCSAFHEPPETYEYLTLTVKKKAGARADIENALHDPQISEKWKRRLHKLIYRNYIFLDGQPVKIDRQILVDLAVKRFAKDLISYEDFTKRYLAWLNELGLGDNDALKYNLHSYENRLSSSDIVLWNYKNAFRYYDVRAVSAKELFDTIPFEQYSDTEISTLLIFRAYPEIMREYDIRDEYELHNLLRKLGIAEAFPVLDIKVSKMPTLVFGKGNMPDQALELLIALSPVSYEELAAGYEERYGVKKETAAGYLLRYLDEYYYKGVYSIEAEGLLPEEMREMQYALTEEFYLRDEIISLYRRLFPQGEPQRINAYSLKTLGFHVYESYVVSKRYLSAADYFDHLLLDHPITDMTEMSDRLTKITAYSSEMLKLKAERRIVEFTPKQFITMERLNECGITLADIERYCSDIAELTDEGEFFTLQSLRNQGFSDELDDYGFDDWFYMSLLCEDKAHFSYRRVANTKLFCRGTKTVTLQDFFTELLLRLQKIDFYDFMDLLEQEYGIALDPSKVKTIIRESDLYYNDIMDAVYIDYDTYYEEV